MLFLQSAASGSAQDTPPRLVVNDAAGLCLERALLASERSVCISELELALEKDRNLANWAITQAERQTGLTVNRVEEAAVWLADHLAPELAAALSGDASSSTPHGNDLGWRLPALLRTLAGARQQVANFEQRLEREKLDAMKELAYGASHEINNPLANIAARAQTLLDDEPDPQRRQKLTAIHRQAMRAHEMISDLMLFARPPKLQLSAVDLAGLITQIVVQVGLLAREREIRLTEGVVDHIELLADKTQLGVAIHAVLRNAVEAVDDGGQVTISAEQSNEGGQQWAKVVVVDNGPGISTEVRRHAFDPFFSGREAGRGLGFGLSKCWRIVTEHAGKISIQSPASGGAVVTILLPLMITAENNAPQAC